MKTALSFYETSCLLYVAPFLPLYALFCSVSVIIIACNMGIVVANSVRDKIPVRSLVLSGII